MRGDVQDIFKMTPHDKQVMMFSATLSKEIRPVCKKFMSDVSLPRRAAAAAAPPASIPVPTPVSPTRPAAAASRGCQQQQQQQSARCCSGAAARSGAAAVATAMQLGSCAPALHAWQRGVSAGAC